MSDTGEEMKEKLIGWEEEESSELVENT